jgi:predicted phage tail protein
MRERNLRGVIAVALGVCLSVGLFATNAIAKPAPVTKIRFKLADHNVPPGSPVTSDVLVRTRSNHEWVPFASALLSVRVDGSQVLTITTDASGVAAISYVAAAGGHVMKVVFVGDATHKRAQRAQGFAVVAGATTVPSAPTLTATPGFAMVHLSWTAPADGGSAITTYNIYRSTISGSEVLLTSIPSGPVFDDFAVLSATTYFYEVSAVTAEGEGALSSEVSATPL